MNLPKSASAVVLAYDLVTETAYPSCARGVWGYQWEAIEKRVDKIGYVDTMETWLMHGVVSVTVELTDKTTEQSLATLDNRIRKALMKLPRK